MMMMIIPMPTTSKILPLILNGYQYLACVMMIILQMNSIAFVVSYALLSVYLLKLT